MKNKNKLYSHEEQLNFFRLMDEAMSDNLEEIKKELEEEEIDIDEIQNNLLEMVKAFKAEMFKQQGRLFKEDYLKKKTEISEIEIPGDLAIAFRKDQNNNSADSVTDDELKKFSLLKKSSKKIFGKSNEQSSNDSQSTDR